MRRAEMGASWPGGTLYPEIETTAPSDCRYVIRSFHKYSPFSVLQRYSPHSQSSFSSPGRAPMPYPLLYLALSCSPERLGSSTDDHSFL